MNRIIVKSDNVMLSLERINQVLNVITKKQDAEVIVREHKESRTLKQNKLLFLWHGEVKKYLEEHHGIIASSDDVHEEMISRLLPMVVSPITMKPRRQSTRDLKVKEFAELLEKYEAYMASEKGVFLSRPDDLYYVAVHGAKR
jgi:tRNA U34 5-carboxymethylaminomethyl modifying enzyme MnmG/GidA